MSSNVETGSVTAFEQEQLSPWGKLQYSTSLANIQRHIHAKTNGRSLQVLDVGGGSGIDAVAFAGQGHMVTLVDPSREMLAAARRRAAEQGVSSQITLHQASLWDLPVLFVQATFDLVLCHHVLQYVKNVTAALQTLLAPLHPDGIASILGINRYSEAYRQSLQQHDLAAALVNLDARSIKATVLDAEINAYAGVEVRQELVDLGCEVLGEYGVRCICDYLADSEIKHNPEFFAQLEELELAMSDTYPYNLLARNFQVIARKL